MMFIIIVLVHVCLCVRGSEDGTEYCSWDVSNDRCRANSVELLSLLDTSTNPFAHFMRCELLTSQQSCTKYPDTCEWTQDSIFLPGVCSVKLSTLALNLTVCVDSSCKQDLLKVSNDTNTSTNSSILPTKNCDYRSFLTPPPDNKFCQIAQENSNCYQNDRGVCKSQYCFYDDGCNQDPIQYPSITSVDDGISNLMNLRYSVQLIFSFDLRAYHRIRVLDSYVLDALLGFKKGTMEKFHYCSFLEDCTVEGHSKYMEQVQRYQDRKDNTPLGFGWGIIILIMFMSVLCCIGVCSAIQRIRYRQNRYNRGNSLQETELSEFQNNENVSNIMSQLQHSKYKLKSRDIENQVCLNNQSQIQSDESSSSDQNQSMDEQQYLDVNLTQNSDEIINSNSNQCLDYSVRCCSNLEFCEGEGGSEEDAPLCAICYDGYIQGQDVTHLKCGHMYHMLCIERWIKFKGFDSSCPLCASKLVKNSVT